MSRIRGIGSWVKGAVGHRQIVYALVFIGVISGIWGTFRMNKDEFPTFDIKQGLVVGIYPGATAEQVEEQLAKPLENTLFSFREVTREYTRTVCRDGICYIITDLSSPQSKKDEVWSKIKLKLQQAKQLMPPGVLAVAVLDSFSET
jgi:multidrug efflux pump subunit AcrB